MKCWLALLFIPSFALADPTFGPEIEFRGRRHLPSMACGVTLYSENKIFIFSAQAAGFGAFGAALDQLEAHEERSLGDTHEYNALDKVVYGMLGSGVTAGGATLACKYIRAYFNRAYDKQLTARLEKLCEGGRCRLEIVPRSVWWDKKEFKDMRLTYPDGTQFTFSHDPAVVEVNTSPLTAENLARNLKNMQTDVFDLLKEEGLAPPKLDGPWNGGHVHVGVEDSFRNVRHLRDFLADLYAHPELGYGILLEDQVEGPSVGKDGGARLKKAIEALDERMKVSNKFDKEAANILAGILPKNGSGITFNSKYNTIELRFIRAQKSAADLLKLFKLLEARIESLRKNKRRLPVADASPPRGTVEERRAAFRSYVEGAGLEWEEYQSLAPPPEVMRANDFRSYCISAFGSLFK